MVATAPRRHIVPNPPHDGAIAIISANARLYAHDGDVLRTYRDHYGRLAIGFDHTRSTVADQTVTAAYARGLLIGDLAWLTDHTEPLLDYATLTAPQWAALLSFAHSMRFSDFRQTTVLARIRCGRLDDVPREMAKHVEHGGRVLRMLVRRRQAEGILWASQSIRSKPPLPPFKMGVGREPASLV